MNTVAWVIGAGIVAFFVAELVTRYLIRSRGRYYVLTPHEHIEFDIDNSILPNLEDHVRVQINSEGERGEEVPRHAKRLYRVLVAGGSSTECYFLDQESSWPMRVQRTLERPENLTRLNSSHVHVGNIGQSSFDAEALEAVLQKILPRMKKLDALVIFTGVSDVLNWLSAGAPEVIGENPNVNPSLYFAFRPDMIRGCHPRHTALSHVLRRLRNRMVVKRRPQKVGQSIARLRSLRAAATEIRDKTPDPEPMLRHLEQHLANVLTLAKTAASRVVVVPQPWFDKEPRTLEEEAQFWNGAVGNPHLEAANVYYSIRVISELLQDTEQSIVRVARRAGVECVKLRTEVPCSRDTYYDQFHFTPAGSAIIAGIIAESLIGNKGNLGRHAACGETLLVH